jgi:hypothetical protein
MRLDETSKCGNLAFGRQFLNSWLCCPGRYPICDGLNCCFERLCHRLRFRSLAAARPFAIAGTRILLGSEAALLLSFGLYAIAMPHAIHSPSDHLQILLLAVAMGLQAVAGQTISPTTIVFTTTLTNLASTVVDSIANGGIFGLKDVKIQSSVVVSYLFGALLSGALIVHKMGGVVVVPFLAVATAFLIQRKSAQTPL